MKRVIITTTAVILSVCVNAQISIGGSLPKLGGLKKKSKEETTTNPGNGTQSASGKENAVSSKYTQEEKEKILALGKTEEYYADARYLQRVDARYNTNFDYWVVAHRIDDAVAQMDSFPADRKKVDEINKKYADFWAVFKETEGREETKQYYYHRSAKGLHAFENRVKTGYTDVPKKINEYLTTARTNAEKLFAEKKIKDESSNYDYYTEQVENNHFQAYFLLNILKFQKGKEDAEFISLWKKYEAEVKELGDKRINAENAIKLEKISAVACPQDVYAGSDEATLKANLKKHWMKLYPADKILNVYILDKNWDRQSGQDWDNSYNRWVKFDNSWLMVNVVVQDEKDPTLAHIFEASIQKNHMKNNEISYDYFNKSLGIGKGSMLKAKVK